MNGSEETSQTTGVSVTNQNIANNLIDKVAELLDAKSVRHFYCSDRTTEHKKIVIEYDHGSNLHKR